MVQSGASIFGTLTSGNILLGTRPNLVPFKYHGETDIYQIPYANASDIGTGKQKSVSAKEEARQCVIVENQLKGIVRAHYPSEGFVVFDGQFADVSNHPANNLIISLSGISAFAGYVYIGELDKEYSWSGLSHSSTNYLWMSMVEEPQDKMGRLSSRQYRDFETRFNTTGLVPAGPENSVLVATYTSGVGINPNPVGKTKMVLLKDHINSVDPHGSKWFQTTAIVSGMEVLSPQIWNYNNTSGIFSGMFNNVRYLNNVTIVSGSRIITSGVLGHTESGNLNFSFFGNLTGKTLDTDFTNVGNLIVVSGLQNSGLGTNLFRNHIRMGNFAVDGFKCVSGVPLISQLIVSGNGRYHTHGLDVNSGIQISVAPKYPGTIYSKPVNPTGLGTSKPFEYNTDFGSFIPTLRHKAATDSTIYVRNFVPQGYSLLDAVETTYRIDSGSKPIELQIRDCTGTLLTPNQGFVLSSSGLHTMVTSGFSQAGFSQNLAFDLEYTFRAISGTSQYLGGVVYKFKSN